MKKFDKMINSFRNYMKLKCGYKKNTVESYLLDVKKYLKGFNSHQEITDVDSAARIKFLVDLKGDDTVANASKNRYISAINCLHRYLGLEKPFPGIKFDVEDNFNNFKNTEVDAAINAADLMTNATPALRTKVTIVLAYYYGLKSNEIINLKVEDLSGNNLSVPGRVIRLSAKTRRHLDAWIVEKYKIEEKKPSKWMFVNMRGNKLKRHILLTKCHHAAALAELPKHEEFTMANLRNSFAVNLALANYEAKDIAKRMGLSSTSQALKFFI